jgi:hypothetical protein
MRDIVIRMRYDESIGRVVTNVVTVYKEIICENNVRIIEINFREYRRGNPNGQSRETGNIEYTRRRKTK